MQRETSSNGVWKCPGDSWITQIDRQTINSTPTGSHTNFRLGVLILRNIEKSKTVKRLNRMSLQGRPHVVATIGVAHVLIWAVRFCCRTGIVCAGGSDAPVESPQPLLGIYDSIFRPAGNRLETTEQFRLLKTTLWKLTDHCIEPLYRPTSRDDFYLRQRGTVLPGVCLLFVCYSNLT